MNKSSKSGVSAGGKLAILLVLFGLPLLFFIFMKGTSKLAEWSSSILFVLIILASTIYTFYTSRLLYKYFDAKNPIWSIVPCVGELSLMDSKYAIASFILYICSFVMFGLTVLPYNVTKIFGEMALQTIPFYGMIFSLLFLFVIQIIKGIGMCKTVDVIADEWFNKINTSLGFITKYKALLFIPFIRVIGLYVLSKPLDTLVTYNGLDVNSDVLGELEEDEE